MESLISLALVTAPLWAIICGIVAGVKRRPILGWAFFGLLFGPIGLWAIATSPSRRSGSSGDTRGSNPAASLAQLADLHDRGAVTDEEFAEKKRQLLERI